MKFLINILLVLSLSISHLSAIPTLNTEEAISVKISSVLKEAEVYPNPAEEFIYLKINDQLVTSRIKIEVMSIIGNKMNITHEKIKSGLYKINLQNIPSGHYYVMLTIDEEKSLKKFIKK